MTGLLINIIASPLGPSQTPGNNNIFVILDQEEPDRKELISIPPPKERLWEFAYPHIQKNFAGFFSFHWRKSRKRSTNCIHKPRVPVVLRDDSYIFHVILPRNQSLRAIVIFNRLCEFLLAMKKL